MSTTMKTPGVYIQELDAFGNSVVPVATAIPAFIGYTGKTSYNGKSLVNKPVRVTSLAEFLSIFGSEPPRVQYSVTAVTVSDRLDVLQAEVDGTAKTLEDAQKEVDAVTEGDPSKELTDALDLAKKENDEAIANLAAGKTAIETEQGAEDYQSKVDRADFTDRGIAYLIDQQSINYRLYGAIKFFYANGGAVCYVMSVGGYDFAKTSISDTTEFTNAITMLEKEMEPTMLVIPDVVEIFDDSIVDKNTEDYYEKRYAKAYSLQNAMINHCGEMMDRVAVLDIPGGYIPPGINTTSVQQFRTSVSPENSKFNSYAAAYYPWLQTTVFGSNDISSKNIKEDSYQAVKDLLTNEFTDPKTGIVHEDMEPYIDTFYTEEPTDEEDRAAKQKKIDEAHKVLQNLSGSYKLLMKGIENHMNLIAPAAGMAGIYTSVDNNDGVWKAPANVGMQSTIKPAIAIDHAEQEDLNMPVNGKSICAIRAFVGRGNLVWGARTLDGNSNDWRYVNVRRTLIFLEQSVKEAAKAFVFAPNDATTWVTIKSMISNFLIGIWKQGGLVGPKAADAFSVSVGLGSTMTNDDIQNGIMRIMVKVAVSHPAEFIEITWQQKMQEA